MIPELDDGLRQDDWVETDTKRRIAETEEQILAHQWTLKLYSGFATLAEDERFQRLIFAISERRTMLLEQLAVAVGITPPRLGWVQGEICALTHFTQLAKGDPQEVSKARLELPGLTEQLEHLRSLLHVPGATSGRRDRDDRAEDGSQE